MRGTTGKIFLVVDRLQAHQTPAVRAWVAARNDRLELFPLPRRAPELNPDEYLNNDLKGGVNAAGLPATVLSGRTYMSCRQAEQPVGGGLNLLLGDPGT